MTGIALALLAGLLSTLSPCVLPLLPIVVGTALGEHRYGPVALAAGLSLSFALIGMFIATIGLAIGFEQHLFRQAIALVMFAIGTVLLLPRLQLQLATAAGPVGTWVHSRAGGLSTSGLGGQFAIGLLLGAVWTPCVGPTLGAATVLAGRAEDLPTVAATMLMFGLGAALPLLGIGLMSREAVARWRQTLLTAGTAGKTLLGGTLVIMGLLILSGLDKRIETFLLDISPAWITHLTTRL